MIVAPEHRLDIIPRKILVIQLGDIGDVVWSIPTFRAIKASFPAAGLFVVTRKPYGDLLLDDVSIEKIFQVSGGGIWPQIKPIWEIKKERFDLLFDLRGDDRGAVMSLLSGARTRCALYYPGLHLRNRAFTHLIEKPVPREKKYGAAEQSLRIMRKFGIPEVTYAPQISVKEETKKKVERLLVAEGIATGSAWVSVNPFSRWSYKEWDAGKWREVISFIWREYHLPAVIVGSVEEQKRAEILISDTASPVINLTGRTNLRELAALLKMSKLHIGVDSAPPHIAAAVGTPNLTIYGPSDWRDWVLPDKKNQVVVTDMPCSPCYQKGCDGSGISKCLEDITADMVTANVRTIMDVLIYQA